MGDYSPFENLMATIQNHAHGEGLQHYGAKAEIEHTALLQVG